LGEEAVRDLAQCIRMNLDCADVCAATGALASRRSGSDETILKSMLDTCAQACRLCGEECGRHARKHQHCAKVDTRWIGAQNNPDVFNPATRSPLG
jgi:hypothetical protein